MREPTLNVPSSRVVSTPLRCCGPGLHIGTGCQRHRPFQPYHHSLQRSLRRPLQVMRTTASEDSSNTLPQTATHHLPRIHIPENVSRKLTALNERYRPPKYLWRSIAAFIIAGEAVLRIGRGRIHWRNTLQQLYQVGPRSLGVCLLTSFFLGMVFTIQFIRCVWVGGTLCVCHHPPVRLRQACPSIKLRILFSCCTCTKHVLQRIHQAGSDTHSGRRLGPGLVT